MPPELGDSAYLWDMLDAARAVVRFTSGKSFAAYSADEVLRAAVERKLEIVGEAARHVSKTFRLDHPEIPWHKITSQRHVLAHEYGEIEDEIIWRVVTIHVLELISLLEPLVPEA